MLGVPSRWKEKVNNGWITHDKYAHQVGVGSSWLRDFLRDHAQRGKHYGCLTKYGKATWINVREMDALIGTLVLQTAAVVAESSTETNSGKGASVSPISSIPQLE